MRYKAKKIDKGLLVQNVELMSYVTKKDRPNMSREVDIAWLNKAVETFLSQKPNKLPRLLRRHNEPGNPAEVIGTVDNLRVEGDWLVGDILVTEPQAQAKLLRGELPSRSAEFSPGRHLFWGLSLIDGEEGHFDQVLPDLRVEHLRKEDVDNDIQDDLVCLSYKEPDMELKEQIEKLAAENAELKTKLAASEDPEVKMAIEKLTRKYEDEKVNLVAEHAKQIAEMEVKLDIETKTNDLKALGCALTTKQIRTKLAKCDSAGSRAAIFDMLKLVKEGGIKLELDPTEETPEMKLRKEYEGYKATHPDTKLTVDEYVKLNSAFAGL